MTFRGGRANWGRRWRAATARGRRALNVKYPLLTSLDLAIPLLVLCVWCGACAIWLYTQTSPSNIPSPYRYALLGCALGALLATRWTIGQWRARRALGRSARSGLSWSFLGTVCCMALLVAPSLVTAMMAVDAVRRSVSRSVVESDLQCWDLTWRRTTDRTYLEAARYCDLSDDVVARYSALAPAQIVSQRRSLCCDRACEPPASARAEVDAWIDRLQAVAVAHQLVERGVPAYMNPNLLVFLLAVIVFWSALASTAGVLEIRTVIATVVVLAAIVTAARMFMPYSAWRHQILAPSWCFASALALFTGALVWSSRSRRRWFAPMLSLGWMTPCLVAALQWALGDRESFFDTRFSLDSSVSSYVDAEIWRSGWWNPLIWWSEASADHLQVLGTMSFYLLIAIPAQRTFDRYRALPDA